MPNLPIVWWLDDSNAPTNSPSVDPVILRQVIEMVGEYTINDLQALKELREKIVALGVPPEVTNEVLRQKIEEGQTPSEET